MQNNLLNDKFYDESWFFRAVMEQINVSVLVTNTQEEIIYVNPSAEKLFGYSRKELLGKHPRLTNAELNSDEIQKGISIAMGNDEVWHGRLKNRRKNGEIFLLDLTVCPLKNEDGDTVAFIGFQKDVTEENRSRETLKEIAEELQQSNKELEQFAYVASHDLQEPLRVVSSYCQLLKEKKEESRCCSIEDKEVDKYFNYIIDATDRMKTLVKELLDFSRVGRKDKPFENINLVDLMDEVIIDFEITINDTKASIVVESNLPNIFAIRFRIKQLLHNLISNALKFRGKKKPLIRIGCCDEDDCWLFYVKDNGVGIESKYFDRIFGIFKRLYSREEYPGTGIGLALCKRIVDTHNGKIWIDSKVGEGTCVYFTIPKFNNE